VGVGTKVVSYHALFQATCTFPSARAVREREDVLDVPLETHSLQETAMIWRQPLSANTGYILSRWHEKRERVRKSKHSLFWNTPPGDCRHAARTRNWHGKVPTRGDIPPTHGGLLCLRLVKKTMHAKLAPRFFGNVQKCVKRE